MINAVQSYGANYNAYGCKVKNNTNKNLQNPSFGMDGHDVKCGIYAVVTSAAILTAFFGWFGLTDPKNTWAMKELIGGILGIIGMGTVAFKDKSL